MTADRRADRRNFLKLGCALGASAMLPMQLMARSAGSRQLSTSGAGVDLNGAWQVNEVGQLASLPAIVPGCIHTDLLAAGRIPDPFQRDNTRTLHWIDERDWRYTRHFDVSEALLQHPSVELVCDGLDTLASVSINGQQLAEVDNMFRTWRLDVRKALVVGSNTIEIVFHSMLPHAKERQAKAPHSLTRGGSWVRKAAYMSGWDWAPVLRSCGIWRDIRVEACDCGRIADFAAFQQHRAGAVELQLQLDVERFGNHKLQARAVVSGHGMHRTVALPLEQDALQATAELQIDDPKLWWPNGMGEQPLYQVQVALIDGDGRVIDTRTQRIGLRQVKLIADSKEHPLQLEINGVPFFAKGSNWVPPDSFPSRVTKAKLEGLMRLAVGTNMNILRFWGGGYYEEDALYELCDELGLLVWLDFKFANSSFPVFDARWMDNVRHEIRDNVRRLRHHPCIAVWSGNNEVGTLLGKDWSDGHFPQSAYDALFKKLIPDELHAQFPTAQYTPGSPYAGDTHDWDVWHGNAPFESYEGVHGFMTEFGFQSFPAPASVDAFTDAEDRLSANSRVLKFHQRDGSGHGNQMIVDAVHTYLGQPRSFDDMLLLSQIAQAYAVQIGAEHWRRDYPRSTACIYWQYNDCWPSISWASIDYYNRPKALQYVIRRSYAPVLVSAALNRVQGTAKVMLSNDLAHPQAGTLICRATDAHGRVLRKYRQAFTAPARTSSHAHTLDLADLLKSRGAGDLLLWLHFESDDTEPSENLLFFGKPNELALRDPAITSTVKSQGKGFEVTLTAKQPALWVLLEVEGTEVAFQDNFLHFEPGCNATVLVTPQATGMTAETLHKQLKIRSYIDLVQPARSH